MSIDRKRSISAQRRRTGDAYRGYQPPRRTRGNRDYRSIALGTRAWIRLREASARGGRKALRTRVARSTPSRLEDEVPTDGKEQWPALRELSNMDALPTSSYRYLLDLDDDLAAELDLRMRLVARQVVTAVVFVAPPGGLRPLVLLRRRSATDPGVLPDRRCADPSTFASAIARPPRSWATGTSCNHSPGAPTTCSSARRPGTRSCRPGSRCSTTRSPSGSSPGRRSRASFSHAPACAPPIWDVQRAITSQPRLEVRLTLLLWHLAGRWGRVERGGIRLALPLTHRLLGRLVGAERPSVSHALSRLSQAGLVTNRDGALHLQGTASEHLAALAPPAERRAATTRRPTLRSAREAGGRFRGPRSRCRAPDRPRPLAYERAQLRRRVGLADRRDQPEPGGVAARRNPGTAAHRPLQPASGLRRRRRLPQGLARGRARRTGSIRARRRGVDRERGDQRRGPLERASVSTRRASRSPPAPGSTGWRRAPRS